MKRMRRSIRRLKGHAVVKPRKKAWSPFFEPTHVRFLVKEVVSAARNDAEAGLFLRILRRAYDDTLELEGLYRELPGVLSNEAGAVRHFSEILMYSRPPGMGGKPYGGGDRIGYRPLPDAVDARFCDRPSLIRPSSIFEIAEGIHHLSRGDGSLYDTWTATLRGLRDKGARLERLFQLGLDDGTGKGGGRLGDELRRLGRDSTMTPDGDPIPDSGDDLWPQPGKGTVTWPPGQEIQPWPDHGLPGGYHDFCYVIEPCLDQAIDDLGHVGSPPDRTWATGIASIEPNRVCPPATVTIRGTGFGNMQPDHVGVVVGELEVNVLSWSDTAIRVRIPLLVRSFSGCVGFIDKLYDEHLEIWQSSGGGRARSDVEGFVSRCTGAPPHGWRLPDSSRTAPCTGVNLLGVGRPTVEFTANGVAGEVNVDPSVPVLLGWHVHNADSFVIRRTSPDGPSISVTDPGGDMLDIGPFVGSRPADATYELVATNGCGTTTAQLIVHLRKTPILKIVGIELIQAIQRFSVADPANNIRLVAGKRTMARVYVDSGISDGFDGGVGANVQPNVTGAVAVFPFTVSALAGPPLNAGGVISARPAADIARSDLTHTLNFDLPIGDLRGQMQIVAKVWVQGHEAEVTASWADLTDPASGWVAYDSVSRNFEQRKAQRLVRILVQDDAIGTPAVSANPPTEADYETSLQGARTRYPIADDGFDVELVGGFETITTTRDLKTRDGWDDLLDDIDDIADDSEPRERIWTAIVPDHSDYNLNGIGTAGRESKVPGSRVCTRIDTPWGPVENCFDVFWGEHSVFSQMRFVARAAFPATFAHEMAHTFGVGHAPCGLPADETPDPDLPASTEDVGMDVSKPFLVPSGTSELMSYCTPGWIGATYQDRWISIALWNKIFTALAP